MTEVPRELLGGVDDAPAPPPPSQPALPECVRCGATDLDEDDGSCPACLQASLEERIRAAQESRLPEDWAVVEEGNLVGGAPPKSSLRYRMEETHGSDAYTRATGGIINMVPLDSAPIIDRVIRVGDLRKHTRELVDRLMVSPTPTPTAEEVRERNKTRSKLTDINPNEDAS